MAIKSGNQQDSQKKDIYYCTWCIECIVLYWVLYWVLPLHFLCILPAKKDMATMADEASAILNALRTANGVELHSLASASSSRLNGSICTLADNAEPKDGRIIVQLDISITGERRKINAKLENLRPSSEIPFSNDSVEAYTRSSRLREAHARRWTWSSV